MTAAVCMALAALPVFAAQPASRPVRFKTSDGVLISADFVSPRGHAPVFVLLHGLGSGKGEWGGFASMLAARGYGSLAIDARGHGASGGPRYTEFRSPEAWEALTRDLDAALHWLQERRKIPPERAVLAGASIGANLALRAATRSPRVRFVLLLSPGVDYQGIRPERDLAGYERPVIMAAAGDDPYAFKSCELLFPLARDQRRSRFLRAASGHGVRMLEGKENAAFVGELLAAIDGLISAAAF